MTPVTALALLAALVALCFVAARYVQENDSSGGFVPFVFFMLGAAGMTGVGLRLIQVTYGWGL